MEKAVCYIRVSTQEQAVQGVSLEAQEERLRAYCHMVGLTIEALVKEGGVSASKALSDRPGGSELLSMVGKGKVGHVVALKLDRLFRDAADALNQTRIWDKAGIALHLVDMGGQTLNTASAMGRFFLNMMAGVAELERNLIAERTEMALAHKKSHLEVYSPTPYGYDREGGNLTVNQHELKAIAKIREWRLQGWSLRKIAQELTRLNIPTKRGGKWYGRTVKYLLDNNLYEGVSHA
jgi:DNA invertase Pin-like site-specific DNA recombinase